MLVASNTRQHKTIFLLSHDFATKKQLWANESLEVRESSQLADSSPGRSSQPPNEMINLLSDQLVRQTCLTLY